MNASFTTVLRHLQGILNQFDPRSGKEKTALLEILHRKNLPGIRSLHQYHDALIYCMAYTQDRAFLLLAAKERQRIADHVKARRSLQKKLVNTGLPYTQTVTSFSFDLLQWLIQQKDVTVTIDSFGENPVYLNEALRQTLPDLEKFLTTLEYRHDALFEALGIASDKRLSFLLTEFSKFASPDIRDFFFDRIGLQIRITPSGTAFSRAFNRVTTRDTFFRDELLKRFDHRELINCPLPDPDSLDTVTKTQLVKVIRYDLALLGRETDPSTYLDQRSLRYYVLERGISVALYTMIPARQLPLESYVGYTLFKNGYPAAYGGSWVFGRYALFGINIHDTFRGGESGYVLGQLLRIYRQLFRIDYFEVEPYQYGKDNPEGINTGAYWFYYKYGFRSVDKTLYRLAEKEHRNITAKRGYRTDKRTLQKFTGSNMALQFTKDIPPAVYDFTARITEMIATRFKGDRSLAVKDCMQRFADKTDPVFSPDAEQQKACIDSALLHEAIRNRSQRKSALLLQMAKIKSQDPYRYQELLREFLS